MPDGAPTPAAGEFAPGSFSNGAGRRSYKLFVPSQYRGEPLPLVVMLHGCTQDPDDFAAGTRMNVVADESGCFVLYPQQSEEANSSRCWNWFNTLDQQRGLGEPSIIRDMTQLIIDSYGIDERRVFIAGMSAGGAMALILGATYPDVYSAVGVHSGIPYGVAQNVFAALTTMRRGASAAALNKLPQIPVIVFHGSKDGKVHPRNADQIIVQLLGSAPATAVGERLTVQEGAMNGRSYERKVFLDSEGRQLAEQWLVHGAGHAWSGGSATGSHTDPAGPDASRQMLRFFLGTPYQPDTLDLPAGRSRPLYRAFARAKGGIRAILRDYFARR